jgi:nucleoside-diphosphate-sugar epimerase
MIKPRIVVTGATGKTGSVVVSELLMAGYPVRAMVHREDGRWMTFNAPILVLPLIRTQFRERLRSRLPRRRRGSNTSSV